MPLFSHGDEKIVLRLTNDSCKIYHSYYKNKNLIEDIININPDQTIRNQLELLVQSSKKQPYYAMDGCVCPSGYNMLIKTLKSGKRHFNIYSTNEVLKIIKPFVKDSVFNKLFQSNKKNSIRRNYSTEYDEYF